jgi:hypothetical protein
MHALKASARYFASSVGFAANDSDQRLSRSTSPSREPRGARLGRRATSIAAAKRPLPGLAASGIRSSRALLHG